MTIELSDTTEELIATQQNYDVQVQSNLELAKQLKNQEEMFETCQA